MKAKDEVQHWRRTRKAMASLLGDMQRDALTVSDLKARLAEMRDLAQEREKAWIAVVIGKADEARP